MQRRHTKELQACGDRDNRFAGALVTDSDGMDNLHETAVVEQSPLLRQERVKLSMNLSPSHSSPLSSAPFWLCFVVAPGCLYNRLLVHRKSNDGVDKWRGSSSSASSNAAILHALYLIKGFMQGQSI